MKASSILIALFAVGCATSSNRGISQDPDLTISIGKENVRVGDSNFAIGEAEAMRAGFAGACARGCDSVEIRAIPMARYDAMLSSYVAGVESSPGTMQLRIAASKPVALAVGEAGSPSSACPAEVVLKRRSLEVFVDGELLPSDNTCEDWGATVCGVGDTDPLKKEQMSALRKIVQDSRPRFRERTCLYAESEMPAMLIDRLITTIREETSDTGTFALRRDRRKGQLLEQTVTDAIVEQGSTLTACYDVELAEVQTPMEAVMKFLIGPDGKVGRVEIVQKAMTTARFEKCLTTAVQKLSFPRPENGGSVTITYPLRFSPK